jgi:hypothetical protein
VLAGNYAGGLAHALVPSRFSASGASLVATTRHDLQTKPSDPTARADAIPRCFCVRLYFRQTTEPPADICVLSATVEDQDMFGLFKKNKAASEAKPQSLSEPAIGPNWQSILNKADSGRDPYREAVTALNVKAICELAPLIQDQSKYEAFQHEASDLALSIRDEFFRSFAIKQVEGLSRSPRARPWRKLEQDSSKTWLITRDRSKWLDLNSRALGGSKTALI